MALTCRGARTWLTVAALVVGLDFVHSACPHVQFVSGVGRTRFPEVFVEQAGSYNGRPIWQSPDGYYLYHKAQDNPSGVGQWIVSNAFDQPHGYAMLDSWALSVVDAPDVSPGSVWHIHDVDDWKRDSQSRVSCVDASSDASFWVEFDGFPHLSGAYIQTGTVWQGGRRVFEQKPPWASDPSSIYLYWVHTNSSGEPSKWLLASIVGETAAVWAWREGEELGPADLFDGGEWKAWSDGDWAVVRPHMVSDAGGDLRWWQAVQKHRNSHFEDMAKGTSVLLSNGVRMPSVGSGTDSLDVNHLSTALSSGVRLLDTATVYQNEAHITSALGHAQLDRGKVFLSSKVWLTELGFNETLMAVGRHLQKLGTAYLDLLLIHWPKCYPSIEWMACGDVPETAGTWQQSWKAFERLYAEGRVRSIGISNFDYDGLWEALVQIHPSVKPHVIQNWFEPLRTDDHVRDLARKYDVQYMGYSPLRNTFQSGASAAGMEDSYSRLREVASQAGAVAGKSAAQAILKWMVEMGVVVIPRSKDPRRQKENVDLFGWRLSPDHIRELSSLAWSRESEL